jgi:antitoxin component YwqK of YwqJK toxin-antitoxin module
MLSYRRPAVIAACLLAAVLGISCHAQLAFAQTESERAPDERVKIQPYTGPPIYLEEKKVVVAPSLVGREVKIEKYASGAVRVERQIGKYSDDHVEADGFYREFHPDGKPFVEGQFREGRQDGEWIYTFDNGQLSRKVNYQGGKLDGVWDIYRADGTLAASQSFVNGLRHGEWIAYDETGKQPRVEEHYSNGKLDGVAKAWHPNGKLRRQISLKNGVQHGLTEEWNDEGKKLGDISYADGKLEGTSTVYRTDGTRLIQQYKNGVLVSEKTE